VTGHDASGKSVFVSDETVGPVMPALMPAAEFHLLWAETRRRISPMTDRCRTGAPTSRPSVASASARSRSRRPWPLLIRNFLTAEEALADMEGKLPGLVQYMDPSDPGMHTTNTIDFEVVLDGTVVLELDDGAQVTLNPGDTVVQNGTRHRWTNPGDTPARLAVFTCGAAHAGVSAS
jgi:mannose-6-phosphate isomerase-like protein (cupin superfamily)